MGSHPYLVLLMGKVTELLGHGALLEKVCPWAGFEGL